MLTSESIAAIIRQLCCRVLPKSFLVILFSISTSGSTPERLPKADSAIEMGIPVVSPLQHLDEEVLRAKLELT